MKIIELKRAKLMRPFRPFNIHLTSGVDIPVSNEDQFAVDTKKQMVFVFGGNEYHLLTAREIAALTFNHKG